MELVVSALITEESISKEQENFKLTSQQLSYQKQLKAVSSISVALVKELFSEANIDLSLCI